MIASIKEFIFKYLNILERMLEQKFLFWTPCRNEFNTQPDANAKWLKLFLASIAKLSYLWAHWIQLWIQQLVAFSQHLYPFFFFFNPPKQRQLYLSPPLLPCAGWELSSDNRLPNPLDRKPSSRVLYTCKTGLVVGSGNPLKALWWYGNSSSWSS